MDQAKIGKFIAERRKKNGFTQMQLAEQLNITDRAVSKWETGRAMPDTSVMPELCRILNISLNDLFSGEVVSVDNYNEQLERNLLEMTKQKEAADKRLLTLEIFIGVTVSVVFVALVMLAGYAQMADWLRIVLIALGLIPFCCGAFYALRIEQVAGYYQCAKCGHRHVPTYRSVLWAMHFGRTRYMKCPECGERSWQKKVLSRQ